MTIAAPQLGSRKDKPGAILDTTNPFVTICSDDGIRHMRHRPTHELDQVHQTMPGKRFPVPTDVELEILNVLWDRGPSTVRQVHNELAAARDSGYSTTLKMMQVMLDKNLLRRDDSVRPQVYRPAEPRKKTQTRMLDRLVQRAFGGSLGRLLMTALSSRRVSPQELTEIKRLIRQVQHGRAE